MTYKIDFKPYRADISTWLLIRVIYQVIIYRLQSVYNVQYTILTLKRQLA
jgi:hypothetical protein